MSVVGESSALATNSHRDVMSPLLATTLNRDQDAFTSGLHSPPTLDISGFTPDMSLVKDENRALKGQLRQLQNNYQNEQDSVYNMRKKMNNQERERLDAVAKLNAEISHLDGEVTKLRAQLERGETSRQSLEYDLARCRRELEAERRAAGEREAGLSDANDSLRHDLCEARADCERLAESLSQHKLSSEEAVTRLRSELEVQGAAVSAGRADRDAWAAERDRHQAAVTLKDRRLGEVEEAKAALEARERQQAETLRQQITETELLRDREDRLQKEHERAQERIRTLEESIEAERAAHLESKFNSEIVQLRIRDLENAVELEKATKTDALAGSEKLDKQVRELQQAYEEERRNNQLTREKLERNWQPILRAEKEYAALNKQLHHELEDKRSVVSTLSAQLDGHQANFDSLKQELSKAKKRQVYLEETYNGSTKEMETLLTNFSLDAPPGKPTGKSAPSTVSSRRKAAPANNKSKKESSKSPSLSVLLESLRHLLMDYKRTVDTLSTDLGHAKTKAETVQKENQQHKDMMWAKDKALQSTQQAMSRTSKELHKLQAETRDAEGRSQQQRAELEAASSTLDRERQTSRALSDQMTKLSTKCKTGEQVSLEFLQTVHKQLLSVSRPSSSPPAVLPAGAPCWTDLALTVNDQVAAVTTDLHRAQDMIVHLEQAVAAKDAQVSQLERAYQSQLEQLGSATEGRSQEWADQRTEMERRYQGLLEEASDRHKRTQTLADQAWEKVRLAGSVQHGLETECGSLRTALTQTRREHQALVAACALLCGALYPLYLRCSTLAAQRDQLSRAAQAHHDFKAEVWALVQALADSDPSPASPASAAFSGRGLLRFRRVVIAVVAARRLCAGRRGADWRLFCAEGVLPGVYRLQVCAGYVDPSPEPRPADPARLQHTARAWLTSGDLLDNLLAVTSELQASLQQDPQTPGGAPWGDLLAASQAAFRKLLVRLPCMFPALQHGGGSGFGGTLAGRLAAGLERAAGLGGRGGPGGGASSHTLLAALQDQVLAFTQRLHTAEVERRDLRAELTGLRSQQAGWAYHSGSLDQAADQVLTLRTQLERCVPRERFESVCEELSAALAREEKAQGLLCEQGERLTELGVRLEVERGDEGERERTLGEAVKGLTEAKVAMRRQDQRARHHDKLVRELEAERRGLEDKVRDAEAALRTAAHDREVVTGYLGSVRRALQQAAPGPPDLAPHHVPGGGGPDLAAAQALVAVVVDAQRRASARTTALLGEVRSHQDHIATLKRELGAACRREYTDQLAAITLGDHPAQLRPESPEPAELSPQPEAPTTAAQPHFSPLREDDSGSPGDKGSKKDKARGAARKSRKSKLPVSGHASHTSTTGKH